MSTSAEFSASVRCPSCGYVMVFAIVDLQTGARHVYCGMPDCEARGIRYHAPRVTLQPVEPHQDKREWQQRVELENPPA